ncbi:MAG: hypothetical protein IIW50_00985 [Alistipes sp.]|nr:hypothetical protein [Alistipes sp.]
MEKTVTIDIEDAENGAIFTEYDEEGGKYVSVKEGDKEFEYLGDLIFNEITYSNLCGGKYRLTIKIEEL